MARLDGKKIRGIIGNVVLKNSGDGKSTIIQAAPVKVNQTKNSKVTAKAFGQGSVVAAAIRRSMLPLTLGFHDSKMSLRSDAVVRDILERCFDKSTQTYQFREDSFESLTGFEFNVKSLVTNYFYVKPEVGLSGNQLIISLPEIAINQEFKFPRGSNYCEIRVLVSFLALEQAMTQPPLTRTIEVSSNTSTLPAQEFVFDVPDGCLCIAGFGLSYFSKRDDVKTVLISKAFKPSNICGAIITPGVFLDPGPVKIGNVTKASPWEKIDKMKLGAGGAVEEENGGDTN